jgi:ATP diphosphatase
MPNKELSRLNAYKNFKNTFFSAKNDGFYWKDPFSIIKQIESECDEIKLELENNNYIKISEEISDLVHAILCLCEHLNLEFFDLLDFANEKFQKRFSKLKDYIKNNNLSELNKLSEDQLKELWSYAKTNC